MTRPLVIGHRGASGYRPEHTLEAYALAARLGADLIEPDLVPTADGVLVARHESELSETTDVAAHPELADRRTRKAHDGVAQTGWFTEDLTLAELRTLRARERLPQLRAANTAWDGRLAIPTFAEVVALAGALTRELGRPVGVYPETKHPARFRALGLPLEELLVEELHAARPEALGVPVWVQSFAADGLRRLRALLDAPLVQLLAPGDPYDLRAIAGYAHAVGPAKELLVPRTPEEGRAGHSEFTCPRGGGGVQFPCLRRGLTRGCSRSAANHRRSTSGCHRQRRRPCRSIGRGR